MPSLHRGNAMIYKGMDESISVAGVILVATLSAALIVTAGLDMMRGQSLQAPSPLIGQRHVYPPIHDARYSRSCRVYRAYQDGTAFAFCGSDRSAYRWEPIQGRWNPITTTR